MNVGFNSLKKELLLTSLYDLLRRSSVCHQLILLKLLKGEGCFSVSTEMLFMKNQTCVKLAGGLDLAASKICSYSLPAATTTFT